MTIFFLLYFQWQKNVKPSVKYLVYRWIIASYYSFVLVVSLIASYHTRTLNFYLIYLTNWSVIMNVISSIFHAYVVTLYHQTKISLVDAEMSKKLKVHWFLATLSAVACITMSTIYWLKIRTEKDKGLSDWLTHAGNAIMMTFDIIIRTHPPRFGHFIYSMVFGIFYGFFFTIPYIYLGGTNKDFNNFIYPSMDWKNQPIAALKFTLSSILFIALVNFLLTVWESMQVFLHKRLNTQDATKECSTHENLKTLLDKKLNMSQSPFKYYEA